MSSPVNMTLLGEALERRMVEVFREFRLKASNPDLSGPAPLPEALESVTVYRGSIKSRERDDNGGEVGPQFPFVLVKPISFTDDIDDAGVARSSVHVQFGIGVRRIGNDGSLDVALMAERIRTSLLASPVIENGAKLELPLEGEIGGDDSFPQWYGIVAANFNIPQPVEVTTDDE